MICIGWKDKKLAGISKNLRKDGTAVITEAQEKQKEAAVGWWLESEADNDAPEVRVERIFKKCNTREKLRLLVLQCLLCQNSKLMNRIYDEVHESMDKGFDTKNDPEDIFLFGVWNGLRLAIES